MFHALASARRFAGSRLFPLVVAQFFDGAGGRFSSLLLGLWAAKLAGIEGFSRFASAGLLGTAVAALVIGAVIHRLPGRLIVYGSVGALVLSRIGSYLSVAAGLGLAPVFVCTFLAAVAGSVMVNAIKVYVPDEGRASVNFAWLGLWGSLGGVIGGGIAGFVAASAPVWLLVALGLPVATFSLVPTLRMAREASDEPVKALAGARHAYHAFARSRQTITLTVGIGAATAGLGLLRDGIVTDLYSSHWIGMTALVALAGGVLATRLIPWLSTRWGGIEYDAIVWPLLAVGGTVAWAFADKGILWLVAGQAMAGMVASTRSSLTEARLMEVAGREQIAFVSSVRDAIGSGIGALMLLGTPELIQRLGYATTSALFSLVLLLIPAGSAMRRTHRTTRSTPALT